MAKRTAIIDIGSNSGRLVLFEKTSHYGFHLICEQKSKVRIGEGAYEKDGFLQPPAIKRAFLTLKSFKHTIEKYQAHKILCVATSALRDAPNGKVFVKWIEKELNLSIKIIDGNKEATYGAIAANNLLPIHSGITVDIGGGSSDMALIENGKIIDTYSLNLGTVRLKELFFDKGGQPIEKINKKAKKYIENELNQLPEHFKHHMVIGIGGTARTLSKSIMKRTCHTLDKLHAFTYEVEDHLDYLEQIPLTYAKSLKKFDIKKNRFDTIREGALIFSAILAHTAAKTVMTSAVGVREGVFLEQMLKHENFQFPKDINPSIVSILDRFKPYVTTASTKKNRLDISLALYNTLQVEIGDELQYNAQIRDALKLTSIGNTLTIYKSHQTAFHIAMQELNYGFVHKEILLISLLLRMHGKELINEALFEQYHTLLPDKQTLRWLSFIYTLTVFIYEASNSANIVFTYGNQTLTITSDKTLYLAKEKIKTLEKPVPFAIIIDDADRLPRNEELGV